MKRAVEWGMLIVKYLLCKGKLREINKDARGASRYEQNTLLTEPCSKHIFMACPE